VLLFTAIKFLATLFRIYRFRRYLFKNTSEHTPFAPLLKNLNLIDKVVTIQSEKPFAFCFGIRYPKIYISTKLISLVTKLELKTILLHERHHLEHRDTLTLLIANIAASLFPFFPLLSDLITAYRTEREILADKAAIKGNSHRNLISIFKKLLQYEPDYNFFVIPAIADPQTLDARIQSLIQGIQYRHTIALKNALISLFSLCIISAFIIAPINAIELHENGRDVMILCSNAQECVSYCKQTFMSPVQTNNFSTPANPPFVH